MATKIIVTLETTGNAAFDQDPYAEVARVLREAADKLEGGSFTPNTGGFMLRDINGNFCGNVAVEDGEDDCGEEE